MKSRKYIAAFAAASIAATSFFGCGDMDETYREFWQDGEIVYAGVVENLRFHPGRNRARISFMVKDPSVVSVRIYWNNKSNFVDAEVDPVRNQGPYYVDLPDLKETTYSFEIYSYNKAQAESMAINLIGRVYGDEYEKTLLITPMKGAYEIEGAPDNFEINWGVADASAIGSELTYTDRNGEARSLYIDAAAKRTLVEGYETGSAFSYRTVFMPDTLSIDKFYSDYKECKVRGIAKEYDRSGWRAYGDDYDKGNVRPPSNTIDGKSNTVWHMDKSHGYPHMMYVDMGVRQRISGFVFLQRLPLDGALNQVEILVSDDGEEWTSTGDYFLENSTAYQFIDIKEEVEARYFQLKAKSDYKGAKFTALAEVGAYRR